MHLACWAPARREFERALDADAVKELRLRESLPVINELGKWISEQMKSTLPKSQIGKAMQHSYARWDALSAYLYVGKLLIDNNQIENAIRPLAIGRKNYLFAGSHDAAQRAAIIYSFFAICKKHNVNPYNWLKNTLQNIATINHKDIADLYPQNFSKGK